MTRVYVCPLSKVHEVVAVSGAGALVSLLSPGHPMTRPEAISPERHLALGLADIVAPLDGHVLAQQSQVESLLAFFHDWYHRWDRARPLVIHCYAGVSRSTAAGYIALCALTPKPEIEIARDLRRLSPSATPNRHLIALADKLLSRGGRMTAAVEAIGRGRDCFEGEVFCMETA
jgi:predicted protein tyrosine phosphatase